MSTWCHQLIILHCETFKCRIKRKSKVSSVSSKCLNRINGNPSNGSLIYQIWSVGVKLSIECPFPPSVHYLPVLFWNPISTWNYNKVATYKLKLASYSKLFAELTSPHVNQVSPDTVLQGHSHWTGPMLPKTTVIGFKTCKQARAFFFPQIPEWEVVQPDLDSVPSQCCREPMQD